MMFIISIIEILLIFILLKTITFVFNIQIYYLIIIIIIILVILNKYKYVEFSNIDINSNEPFEKHKQNINNIISKSYYTTNSKLNDIQFITKINEYINTLTTLYNMETIHPNCIYIFDVLFDKYDELINLTQSLILYNKNNIDNVKYENDVITQLPKELFNLINSVIKIKCPTYNIKKIKQYNIFDYNNSFQQY